MTVVELADVTTLRVGGPARELRAPGTRDELVATAREVWETGEDWLLLGGGSNVVIADEGFDGTVIRVATRGIDIAVDADGRHARVRAAAGESWDGLVAATVQAGLAGVEALSGIPGTVGAAPVQNIGAYGQELGERLVGIDFLDYATGEVLRLDARELGLGYRTSALKRGRAGIVLAVELDLDAGGHSGPVAYAQLSTALGVALGDRVPLADARRAVLALRASKGMVLDAADPDSVSAGSFFTNPIVSESFARALPAEAPRWPVADEEADRVLAPGEDVPPLASAEYRVKLSAAWLIERSGIARGFALPGSRAAISSKHTLAIVNCGGATASEIVQLAGYVQTRVLAEFGVRLQPEPVFVGVSL
ncbi:UDP-N-acetylmuramate dehydrogenase [Protaetiibacter intestinalis]|uniref:UDP-N-acetylenolpyruvoylglucosamine reductase n=1 Tax=Protaetiibacter intestinalis TaxID=2419774 RepID=A0A387B721_9MICO|nr:UDP-N-acetylmuramate dehydrogenase [Protaetiibacter intestinalis]AYF98143.1 UDP-N-acetylmuramate dehydrogenase [Protaetiibacter intestinalis]